MAVDARGGLWFATLTDTLRYFTAAQITSSTNTAPSVRLVSPSNVSITALAIDAAGNLWVADQYANTVSEFTASQLTVSGTVTPAVVISAVVGTIQRPWGLTFDAKGDLWLVNYGGSSIVGYSPAQIAVSGAPVPFAGISGSQGSTSPLSATFDAQGNLWVATILDSLSKYNAADLNALGAPTPSVVITGTALQAPVGIAFDESGAIWVSNYVQNTVVRYNASQLAATGSPAPAAKITLGSGSTDGDGIVFSPRARNLPVH
jgi:sugar lactone lactonase YvrE